MKVETIVKDAAIDFAGNWPEFKNIISNAFDKIRTHYNAELDEPENFQVQQANSYGSTNRFDGAFITSIYGSYLLHDIGEETKVCDEDDITECTIVFYSLSKITDDDAN